MIAIGHSLTLVCTAWASFSALSPQEKVQGRETRVPVYQGRSLRQWLQAAGNPDNQGQQETAKGVLLRYCSESRGAINSIIGCLHDQDLQVRRGAMDTLSGRRARMR